MKRFLIKNFEFDNSYLRTLNFYHFVKNYQFEFFKSYRKIQNLKYIKIDIVTKIYCIN